MMKIALTRGNSEESTPPRDIPYIIKKTYQIKTAKLVSIFAARWRSIRKYFSGQTTGKTKQEKATVIRKHHTHLHSERKPKKI
jgi:hypothetical protein